MDDVILMIRAINNKKRVYMFNKKEQIKKEGIQYLANKNKDENLSPRVRKENILNMQKIKENAELNPKFFRTAELSDDDERDKKNPYVLKKNNPFYLRHHNSDLKMIDNQMRKLISLANK